MESARISNNAWTTNYPNVYYLLNSDVSEGTQYTVRSLITNSRIRVPTLLGSPSIVNSEVMQNGAMTLNSLTLSGAAIVPSTYYLKTGGNLSGPLGFTVSGTPESSIGSASASGTGNLYLLGGAHYAGGLSCANDTEASGVNLYEGGVQFLGDTGLTIGNAYTPTIRGQFTQAGNWDFQKTIQIASDMVNGFGYTIQGASATPGVNYTLTVPSMTGTFSVLPPASGTPYTGGLCQYHHSDRSQRNHYRVQLMKRIIFGVAVFLAPAAIFGQSCTTATCTASSLSPSAVLAALPSNSNGNATVVVNLPSGTAGWSSGISYTVPSGVTSLTIQGSTNVNCTGSAGTSSWGCSATDVTIIQDADTSQGDNLLNISAGSGNQLLRITGITFEGGSSSGANKYNGVLLFSGSTQNLRLDHLHINNNTYSPAASSSWVRVLGSVNGVFDHNVVDLGDQNSVSNGFQAYQAYNDSIGLGDGTYANPTPWGSLHYLYMESNQFNGGAPDDCADGGAFVMRYNTINSAYVGIQTHGTKSPGGPTRGCRAYEAYHNYGTGSSSAPASGFSGSKIGTSLVWGNTMAQGYYRFYQAGTDRSSGDENETNTPNGWGYCGTSTNSNGVGSAWDGNSSASTGYPCLDNLGRGQDQQHLNGATFPNRVNSSTGNIAWSHQFLEPIYMWNNTLGGVASQYALIQDSGTTNNRDYYYDCGTWNSSCSSFTGAAGTGYGVLASRPSTCTAGPGGTFGQSPTGSYGVAYFATDANSGAGELYVCTSTNTWTGIYSPLVYPHPLTGGGGGPTVFSLTISATGGSVSGTNCTGGTYASGTSIGACTATPSGGFTFSGWTATGSSSCTGTGTCGPFNITSNTSLTANFTSTTPQAATPISSPGTGTLNGPSAVTITTTTPSSTIYYTTDGSTPTHGSTVYSGPVSIASGTNTTFKAIAAAAGFSDSNVMTSPYLVVSAGPTNIVGTASTTGTGTASTITRTVSGIGNAIYLMVYSGNGTGRTFSVSDTLRSSWSRASTVNLATDADTVSLFCAIAPQAASDTVTFTADVGTATRALLYEFNGATCASLVTPSTLNSTATAGNSGPITISSSALLLGVVGTDGTTPTISAGSGWSNGATALGAPGGTDLLGESQVSGAGTYTATSAPFGLTAEQGSIIAAFAPSTDTTTCGDPVQAGPNYSNTYPITALPFTIGFTNPTPSCTMHFTSDGSTPTCASTTYTGLITISTPGLYTYRVINCGGGANSSHVIGGVWTIPPASPTGVSVVVPF